MRPDDDDDRDDDDRPGPPPLPPRKRRPVREEDEADDAPQRGVPKWVWGALSFVAVLMLGSCVLGGIYVAGALQKAAREAEAENAQQEKKGTVPRVGIDTFITEWSKNPAAAAEKYKKQPVAIVGTLHRITALGDDIWFILRDEDRDSRCEVNVRVSTPGAREGAKKCTVGQRVEVSGYSDGKSSTDPWMIADTVVPVAE